MYRAVCWTQKWLCIFSSQLTRFLQRYRRWNQEVEKRNRLFKSWCWSFLFVLFFCIGFCYSLPFYVSLLLREGRRENSKTWLDPMDLESLVSTTCTRMFPYQKMYEISGRAGFWSKEKRRRWHNSWKKQLKYTAQWPKLTFHKY